MSRSASEREGGGGRLLRAAPLFAGLALALALCAGLAACAPASRPPSPPSPALAPSATARQPATATTVAVRPTATATASPRPSMAATATATATATASPSATEAPSPGFVAGLTLTLPDPPTPTRTATAPPPPPLEGAASRRITIAGDMQSLQRDGLFLWEAVAIDCRDAEGRTLARLPVTRLEGQYALPAGAAQLTLWIGPELGGADWWKRWDCQLVDAAQPEIALVVRPVPSHKPEPTDCNCTVPTPGPF